MQKCDKTSKIARKTHFFGLDIEYLENHGSDFPDLLLSFEEKSHCSSVPELQPKTYFSAHFSGFRGLSFFFALRDLTYPHDLFTLLGNGNTPAVLSSSPSLLSLFRRKVRVQRSGRFSDHHAFEDSILISS